MPKYIGIVQGQFFLPYRNFTIASFELDVNLCPSNSLILFR